MWRKKETWKKEFAFYILREVKDANDFGTKNRDLFKNGMFREQKELLKIRNVIAGI